MMMTTGIVVDGKIIVAGEPLEEGSTVTILAPSGPDEAGFALGPEEEAALLESIRQADRGELISADELLRDLGSTD